MTARSSKFCIAPFTSMHIAGNGNVYPCCNYQGSDVAVGNIFKDSVDDILLGNRAATNRRRSMELSLPCNSCNFPHKTINPKNITVDSSHLTDWQHKNLGKLQVEIGYFCNSRCSFCEQPHMTKRSVPLEKLKEIVQRCEPKSIVLQGGEVYYNRGGAEFIEWLAENKNGATVFMHTNCVLPKNFAETCFAAIDEFSLNMYGASPSTFAAVTGLKFEKATRFIEELVSIRSRNSGKAQSRLRFKMTTCPTTFHEIPDAILLAERLGLDDARFNFDWFVDDFVKRYKNEFVARIWDLTNEVLNCASIPVDTTSLVKYGFVRGKKTLATVSSALNARRNEEHFRNA